MCLCVAEPLIHRSGDEGRHGGIASRVFGNETLNVFYLLGKSDIESPDVI